MASPRSHSVAPFISWSVFLALQPSIRTDGGLLPCFHVLQRDACLLDSMLGLSPVDLLCIFLRPAYIPVESARKFKVSYIRSRSVHFVVRSAIEVKIAAFLGTTHGKAGQSIREDL